jgi:hypothetical protein
LPLLNTLNVPTWSPPKGFPFEGAVNVPDIIPSAVASAAPIAEKIAAPPAATTIAANMIPKTFVCECISHILSLRMIYHFFRIMSSFISVLDCLERFEVSFK